MNNLGAPSMLAEYGEISNLVPIRVENSAGLVNVRHLYSYLEVGTRFNDWVTKRLSELDAAEGLDFYLEKSKSGGGRPTNEYLVTLDIAKEMGMLERNEKGREVRRYFIAAEKRLRELHGQAVDLPLSPLDLFRQMLTAYEVQESRLSTLEGGQAQLEHRFDDQPISAHADKRNMIFNLVHELGNALGGRVHVGYTWRRFKLHFGLSKYDALPVKRYEEAVALLRRWIADAQRDNGGLYN